MDEATDKIEGLIPEEDSRTLQLQESTPSTPNSSGGGLMHLFTTWLRDLKSRYDLTWGGATPSHNSLPPSSQPLPTTTTTTVAHHHRCYNTLQPRSGGGGGERLPPAGAPVARSHSSCVGEGRGRHVVVVSSGGGGGSTGAKGGSTTGSARQECVQDVKEKDRRRYSFNDRGDAMQAATTVAMMEDCIRPASNGYHCPPPTGTTRTSRLRAAAKMMPSRSTPNLLQQAPLLSTITTTTHRHHNHPDDNGLNNNSNSSSSSSSSPPPTLRHHKSSNCSNSAKGAGYYSSYGQQHQGGTTTGTTGTTGNRDRDSPPPAPPVRDSSSLKGVKYGPGHEKFPSWPVPATSDTPQALRTPPGGGSHRSKSWTDHTNYPKEKVVTYTRPYMKRAHSSQTQQKLKTVLENCEKIPAELYSPKRYTTALVDRVYLPQVDRDGKQLGDLDYIVPSPPERDENTAVNLTNNSSYKNNPATSPSSNIKETSKNLDNYHYYQSSGASNSLLSKEDHYYQSQSNNKSEDSKESDLDNYHYYHKNQNKEDSGNLESYHYYQSGGKSQGGNNNSGLLAKEDNKDNYHQYYQGKGSSNSSAMLTEAGLQDFIKYGYEEQEEDQDGLMYATGTKSHVDGIILSGMHQKQISYAQSEGYHSYVSSTDSTSTPFLDRLRRDSEAVPSSLSSPSISHRHWDDTPLTTPLPHHNHNHTTPSHYHHSSHSHSHRTSREGGRDSVATHTSSGSASSSETLKWHGSMSDVSSIGGASGVVTTGIATQSGTRTQQQQQQQQSAQQQQQLIAHSARVQTPQRHHSESVLYMSSGGDAARVGGDLTKADCDDEEKKDREVDCGNLEEEELLEEWKDREVRNNGVNNKLKLFPVHTYTVVDGQSNGHSRSNSTTTSTTVADRITEFEQQHNQQQHNYNLQQRFSYLDPDKRHKVPDPTLKAIQKKALLSFYERRHSTSTTPLNTPRNSYCNTSTASLVTNSNNSLNSSNNNNSSNGNNSGGNVNNSNNVNSNGGNVNNSGNVNNIGNVNSNGSLSNGSNNGSNNWRSEPHLLLSQSVLSVPKLPARVKVFQLPSRRASSASDYASSLDLKRSSVASNRESVKSVVVAASGGITMKTGSDRIVEQQQQQQQLQGSKESGGSTVPIRHQHSNSCGSLATQTELLLGPVILGPSISLDDWIPNSNTNSPSSRTSPSNSPPPPARPPKNATLLRTAYPDLYRSTSHEETSQKMTRKLQDGLNCVNKEGSNIGNSVGNNSGNSCGNNSEINGGSNVGNNGNSSRNNIGNNTGNNIGNNSGKQLSKTQTDFCRSTKQGKLQLQSTPSSPKTLDNNVTSIPHNKTVGSSSSSSPRTKSQRRRRRVPSPELPPPPAVGLGEVIVGGDLPLPPPPCDLEGNNNNNNTVVGIGGEGKGGESGDWQNEFQERLKENMTSGSSATGQVESGTMSSRMSNGTTNNLMDQTIGIPETFSPNSTTSKDYQFPSVSKARNYLNTESPSARYPPTHKYNQSLDSTFNNNQPVNVTTETKHNNSSSSSKNNTNSGNSNHNLNLNHNPGKSNNLEQRRFRGSDLIIPPGNSANSVNIANTVNPVNSVNIVNTVNTVNTVNNVNSVNNNSSGSDSLLRQQQQQQRASLAVLDSSCAYRDLSQLVGHGQQPPPLQPRQMRVNQSMRARIVTDHHSSGSKSVVNNSGHKGRISPRSSRGTTPPAAGGKEPKSLSYSLSQSKASYLASRRERERIVPDSDTGVYKRTISPNGHVIGTPTTPLNTNTVSDSYHHHHHHHNNNTSSPKILSPTNRPSGDSIIWPSRLYQPKDTISTTTNTTNTTATATTTTTTTAHKNHVNILLRRASLSEKQPGSVPVNKSYCEEKQQHQNFAPMPDVLPVSAKLIGVRRPVMISRPSQLSLLPQEHDQLSAISPPLLIKSNGGGGGGGGGGNNQFTPLRTTQTQKSPIRSYNYASTERERDHRSPQSLLLESPRGLLESPRNSLGSSHSSLTSPGSPHQRISPPQLRPALVTTTRTSPQTPNNNNTSSPTTTTSPNSSLLSTTPPSSRNTSPQTQSTMTSTSSTSTSPKALRTSPSPSASPPSLSLSLIETSPPRRRVSSGDSSTTSSISPQPLQQQQSTSPPKVVEALQLIQRTEVILRVNTTMSDASSQTEREEPPATPLPTRKKLQEEIECEKLSEDFVSQLPTCDRLKGLLVQGPDYKKSTDYVTGLYRVDVTLRPRPLNSPFRSKTTTPSNSPPPIASSLTTNLSAIKSSESSVVPNLEPVSPLSSSSVYFTTSEQKAKLLTRYSQDMNQYNIIKNTKDLSQKKDELVNRLDRKLEVLRCEQLVLQEECRINDELGENVRAHVCSVARPAEAAKFRLHVEEIGKITSLLLGLSGRLARAENALMHMPDDHEEKTILVSKRDKLRDQLDEAKRLKECIDRRSVAVSLILGRYLTEDEYADYDHYINMKAKLIMDSKEILDNIKLGEEQLNALKETLILTE